MVFLSAFHSAVPVSVNAAPPSILPSARSSSALVPVRA